MKFLLREIFLYYTCLIKPFKHEGHNEYEGKPRSVALSDSEGSPQ